ncbi:hypothetical protein GCM10025868_23330 [Angustibacter aerolatus]|uniref:Uncharacterized protein n=1 Tax=Angustibacter aerolatus TaxID=1162965 RepID=A0ABQ6JFX8_9ACTN|nr:hypothetical protein GCM10025868_23330 [Angustibacter aerolatus]
MQQSVEVDGDGTRLDPARSSIAADGTVTVTLRRTARTFVVAHVPPLRHLARLSATATSRATP